MCVVVGAGNRRRLPRSREEWNGVWWDGWGGMGCISNLVSYEAGKPETGKCVVSAAGEGWGEAVDGR